MTASSACSLPIQLWASAPSRSRSRYSAFLEKQAAQCGYCINGMTAKPLLDHTAHPSEDEVRSALAGNLYHCGAHGRIIKAVLRDAHPLHVHRAREQRRIERHVIRAVTAVAAPPLAQSSLRSRLIHASPWHKN